MLLTILVLGLIPGTNIEIGFIFWAVIAAALVVVLIKSFFSNYRLVKSMRRLLDVRLPLPASQFHSRLR